MIVRGCALNPGSSGDVKGAWRRSTAFSWRSTPWVVRLVYGIRAVVAKFKRQIIHLNLIYARQCPPATYHPIASREKGFQALIAIESNETEAGKFGSRGIADEIPPRGGFILPENLVLAGLQFRRRWHYRHRTRVSAGMLPPLGRDSSVNMRERIAHA